MINHLLFMDDLRLYSRSEKRLDPLVQTVGVFSEDMGMIWYRKVCCVRNGTRKNCGVSW